jgi:Bifunctional DNA primase/polymerase, N-terminal
MTAADVAAILDAARALAAEGRKCFPCAGTKRPTTPHGFRDAVSDPDMLDELWRRNPGPLLGLATGEASDLDALDLDAKHPEATRWWTANRHRLPATRTHRTRSGGLHLIFRAVDRF